MPKSNEPTKNELIPIDQQFPVLQQDAGDMTELFEENLGGEGINRFELERINVAPGGAPGYVVQLGEEKDTLKTFDAIVVHHQKNKTYWKHEKSESEASVPDCQSLDGKVGHGDNGTGSDGPHLCDDCPQNQWGSSPKGGRAKACKDQRAIYLYREGGETLLPSMLMAAPTSMRPWRDYSVRLTNKGMKLTSCLHRFETGSGRSAAGDNYSFILPKFVRKLTEEEVGRIGVLAEHIKCLVQASAEPQDRVTSRERPVAPDDDYDRPPF